MQVVVVMMVMASLSLLGFQNASEILTRSSAAVAISYCCFIRFLKKFRRSSRRSVVFYSQSEQPPYTAESREG
jgi:hypothetical protein